MYFFRKKDKDRPISFNLKVMHIINWLALIVFMLGMVYKICEWLFTR